MVHELMRTLSVFPAVALAVVLAPLNSAAQDTLRMPPGNGGFDSAYVIDCTHMLTTRFYVSSKFNAMNMRDQDIRSNVEYRPNTRTNLGLGASYRALTLNIGIGFPFLNSDDSLRGKTRYFDGQANIYGRRWVINLFAQSYRGYYIDRLSYPGSAAQDSTYLRIMDDERLRPDMRQRNLGVSVMHIFGNKRFSYRAAFNQDAWQKRSAGSMLLGGNVVYQGLRADHSTIPVAVDSLFSPALRFRRIDQFEVGGLFGYAHTFVIAKHVFFSLSTSGGLGLAYSRSTTPSEEGDKLRDDWSLAVRTQARVAMGYNSARTYVGVQYVNEQSITNLTPGAQYAWNVGNYRLFITYRFKARVKPVDAAMRWFGQ